MGSTVSLPCSFSTTMGMLVTGSIINPRIFISTSIVALQRPLPLILPIEYAAQAVCGCLACHLAQQTVRKYLCDFHVDVLPNTRLMAAVGDEVQRLVLRGAANHLPASGILPFYH